MGREVCLKDDTTGTRRSNYQFERKCKMKRILALSLFVVAGGLLTIMVTQRVFAAPPAKVLICHVDPDCDGDGPKVISVSERALDAHLAHGDCLAPEGAVSGDACPDLEDSGCDYPDCD